MGFRMNFAVDGKNATLTIEGEVGEVGEIMDRILEDRIAIGKANLLKADYSDNGYSYEGELENS